ncbi:hypothetical protein FGG08_005841 [Glutinoglossum americanum]|uniref:Kinesin light chain n=1 Tax=Glutinoglossum americanum TaxID=1670608 RepID=A0A9P8L2J3_9PEZI|nr:hypothetical protein FGG08_005841 [Glutinoglossum americanum]
MTLECVVSEDDGIVAIHGLYQGQTETWTDPETRTFWLRDLLPNLLPKARIMTYGYKADALYSAGEGSSDRILPHALTLIADLYADRLAASAVERPIIFICHGLGGILVKRALVSSNTSKSKQVEHRRSIFTSTYAILFLSTPHHGLSPETIQDPTSPKPSQLLASLAKGSEVLRDIDDQFAPLTKRFSIYCFWEQLESNFGKAKRYIVDEGSAAPAWDNFERSGIFADHSGMCKFSNTRDAGFKVIFAALKRYTQDAPKVVRRRWLEDRALLAEERGVEARELLRHDSDLSNSDSPIAKANKYFTVPRSASSMFTGRSDIARALRQKIISTRVQDGHHQHKIFVLYGLGGSGKTQFCLKFVEDNRESFWGIFWIDASNDQNAEAGFAYLGSLAKKDTTFEAGKHWLSNCSKSWLLVIDNADDPEMDVSRYFPSGGRGHILITTRNPNNVVHSTIGDVNFRGMEQEDAITLLLKAANRPECMDLGQREIARPIVTTLGHLALALTHAGAAIRRNIYTLEGYLPEYCEHRREMMRQDNLRSADSYKLNIITTWELPYEQIKQRGTTSAKDAIEILHIFAFLHFEQIPVVMFQKAWNNMRDSSASASPSMPRFLRGLWPAIPGAKKYPLPAILSQVGPIWDWPRFNRAIGQLSDYSLIDRDDKNGLCSMHPVVHAWARDRLQPEEQRHLLGVAATVLANSITSELESSGRNYRRALIPHIDSCLQGKNAELLGYDKDSFHASNAIKFASVYAEAGRWIIARGIQRKVVNFRKKTLGSGHPETLKAMIYLGRTCWNLFSMKETLEVQLSVHSTMEKTLGKTNPETLKAMDDLVQTYWLVGNRKKSQELALKAVHGLKETLGHVDPATLTAMHNLGRSYLHLAQPEKAQELLSQVLESRQRLFGIKHPDTQMTMTDLAMSYLALKRLPEAEKLTSDTLRARKHIHGEEHAYTLWSVNDLSKIYCAQGRTDEAIKSLEGILPTVLRTLGNTHIGVSMTKFNLSRAYIGQERWKDAERVLKEQQENLNPNHPDFIHSVAELGKVLKEQGDLAEAERCFLDATEAIIKTQAIGLDHPVTRNIVRQLTEIYKEQGRLEEIRELEVKMALGVG